MNRYQADAAEAYKNGLQDGIAPLQIPSVRWRRNPKYGKSFPDKYEEMLVKSIMAKSADFDKVYDAMLKDYMSNGGEAVKRKERQLTKK